MPVKFSIDGIEVTGCKDSKYEWFLTDSKWVWVNGKRPPHPNYVSVSVLDTVEVHTVHALREDVAKWEAIFADISMNVMDDDQLGTTALTVYDTYDSYSGTPNDPVLGTLLHERKTPSNEMQVAYDRAIDAEKARRKVR